MRLCDFRRLDKKEDMITAFENLKVDYHNKCVECNELQSKLDKIKKI